MHRQASNFTHSQLKFAVDLCIAFLVE